MPDSTAPDTARPMATIQVPAEHKEEFERIVKLLSQPGNLARFRDMVRMLSAEHREQFLRELAGRGNSSK